MAAVAMTYNFTEGGPYKIAATQAGKHYVAQRVVDVAALIAAGSGTLASTAKVTAAEMIGVINIPKNTLVRYVTCRIIEPATAGTIDIGDGADEQGWDAAVDLTAAAGTNTATVHGTDAFAVLEGKLYSTADTIDVQFNADTTDGKFLISAEMVDLSHPTDA